MAKHKRRDQNVINFNDLKKDTPLRINRKIKVEIVPRNIAQENYVEKLNDAYNRIIFAVGPAGTGKTMLAVLKAIEMLKAGEITRIVITRPAVGAAGEDHGFLPGDINQKMEPWLLPILDILEEYWTSKEIANMVADKTIEFAPLMYMRGRTFKNTCILADEIQNTTASSMKMLLTRIGENSRMFVTGDLDQSDLGDKNGLKNFTDILQRKDTKLIKYVKFEDKDVERSEIVKEVLDLYREYAET